MLYLLHSILTTENITMAGAAIAWRNYLDNSLGLSPEQTRAFIAQGYDGHDTLRGVTDEDISSACRNCQRPGGTIPNPVFIAATAAATANNPVPPTIPPTIPDPGVAFGHGHQKKLKMLAFWCTYIDWTNRTWDPAQTTTVNLNRLYNFKEQLEAKVEENNPKFPEKFSDSKKSREILEDIEQWIDASYGDKFPLAYVIRPDIDVPIGNAYPITSYHDDLITRLTIETPAGITDPDYVSHNTKVWDMIYEVTHGTTAWSWVKGFHRSKDGRGALDSMRTHYLGASHINSVKAQADATLNKIFWNGNARNFTFAQFTSKLNDAFTDLADNGEPKTDEEKVRKFLSKITDPKLKVAKATIHATPTLFSDYQSALDFMKGQLDAQTMEDGGQNNRRISEINRTDQGNRGGGRGRGRGRGDYRTNGRGGRGRGGGRGRNGGGRGNGGGRFSKSGHLLNGGGYPPSIWEGFTREEREYVTNLREKRPTRSISEVDSNTDSNPPTKTVRISTDTAPTSGTSMIRSGTSRTSSN